MNKKWFAYENHKSLVVSSSNLGANKPLVILPEIEDLYYIRRIIKSISDLPLDSNEKMKSFAEGTAIWSLKFCNQMSECDQIDFYRGKIKTPNTGIYSEDLESEARLSKEIQSILEPKINIAIPAINVFIFHFALTLILIFFTGCTADKGQESVSSSCSNVPESLRAPKNIEDTIALLNALPKPLTIDCFLTSLKGPLNVFAVNSTFSAQPAVDQQSPRIFLIKEKFVLSVVPSGVGRNLLEFGEFIGGAESFKGEVEFPVMDTISTGQIVGHVSQTTTVSTCVTCHAGERLAPYKTLGNMFASKFIRPSESQRVLQVYLKNQASNCDSSLNKLRCDILKAIFISGQAVDASFPY